MNKQGKLLNNKKVGNWGEEAASKYLIGLGYEILERNYFTPYGEIDIISLKNDQLFFIEVKTRTKKVYGNPETSITFQKREHMINSALFFIQTHPQFSDFYQIDVISVEAYSAGEPVITHFQNAIL